MAFQAMRCGSGSDAPMRRSSQAPMADADNRSSRPTGPSTYSMISLATGFVTATLLASPLAAAAPRLWRGLMVLFITSARWTVAVTLRYLIWDMVAW